MAKPEKKRKTGCPIAYALDTFGDRWTLLIIRDMVLRGAKTYGEFIEAGEGIATNVLADRLRRLEAEGIIRKSRDPENRRKFNYAPTKKGLGLIPVMIEMILWSAKYDPNTAAPKKVLKKIRSDREGFIAEIRARFGID